MTVPVIFLLNGPRRVGKDTAAVAMLQGRNDWAIKPLAEQMKTEAAEHYGLDLDLLNVYEAMKDDPLDSFGGLTWRDLVINYGNMRRKQYGVNYFNTRWAKDVALGFELGMYSAVIMPDCRFPRELDSAFSITPNVLLYRVYRTVALHSDKDAWIGDIGEWIFPLPGLVSEIALINLRELDDLRYEAFTTAHHYFKSVQRKHARAAAAV